MVTSLVEGAAGKRASDAHEKEPVGTPGIAGHREEWFIAAKFGHRYTGDFQRDQLWTADEVLRQLDDSLEALRTDHVDLYQFHSGTKEALDDPELWPALAEQVKAGRIRHLGISISKNDDTYQTSHARDVGAEAIEVVYNRLDRTPEQDVFPICQSHDLGVLARMPLASGYLSGKYRPDATFDDTSDVRSRHDRADVRRKLEEAELRGRRRLAAAASLTQRHVIAHNGTDLHAFEPEFTLLQEQVLDLLGVPASR